MPDLDALNAAVALIEAELVAAPAGRLNGGLRTVISQRLRAARLRRARALGSHTRREWMALLAGAPRCDSCRAAFTHQNRPTKDHIVPLALGGHDGIANIRAVCGRCNSAKGARVG